MVLFFIILFGASIGSFLTVIVFRGPTQETVVFGHSRCSYCRHKLSPADLIPLVSYALRRGRCAYCKVKISWLYPLIELTTTLAFMFAFFLADFLVTSNVVKWIMFFCLAFLFSLLLVNFFKKYLKESDE